MYTKSSFEDHFIRICSGTLPRETWSLVVSALDFESRGLGTTGDYVIVLCSRVRYFTLRVPILP